MKPRTWSPALAALALVLVATPAHAQSRRYAPEPVDFDRASEQHSELWEDVLHPNRDRYRARVERAKEFLRQRDERSWIEAEELLDDAVELAPDEPLAHWMLATLHERRDNWQSCAASYSRVAAIDVKYQPPADVYLPEQRKPDWALEAGLASCQAHTGAYEQAIASYKRVLARGITDQADIYVGLGEAYMALGRLAEAIGALDTALKLQPGNRRTSYALAVAYDRDEREAEARTAMLNALSHDPNLNWLEGLVGQFVPPADEFYYLGLGHAARNEIEWAIVYFRQYLHLTGAGPWSPRARDHLEDLGRQPMLDASRLSLRGTDTVDRQVAAAALARASDELFACMKPVPGLLLELTITTVGKPAGRSSRSSRRDEPTRRVPTLGVSSPEPAGVATKILHSFAVEPEQADKARHCVESVAETIAIPRPSGGADRYLSVSVPLVAPPPDRGAQGPHGEPANR